jgi:hypothetical protein
MLRFRTAAMPRGAPLEFFDEQRVEVSDNEGGHACNPPAS